jgi:hypothetical protein
MTIFKGCADGLSLFSLISVILFSNQDHSLSLSAIMSHKKAMQKFGLQPKLYDYLFVVYLCKILYKWVRWMEFTNFFQNPLNKAVL